MKQLLHLIPSYIKDSRDLLKEIKTLTIQRGAKLFTADATAMYTNITLEYGLEAVRNLLNTNSNLIPSNFPSALFLKTLETVMSNNIFTFGDTFWHQLHGAAMGTPAAPLHSILSFGHHENMAILPNFTRNLFYYIRYIDDVFGIWVGTPDQSWEIFKTQLNSFSNLQWNIDNPLISTTFLDLEISIKDTKIYTRAYQKPINLYLYIPPLSAHPKSCFNGLITGEILQYWHQNSNKNDFINITSLFIQRLAQSGHKVPDIIPILNKTAAIIDHNRANNNTDEDDNTLFIHWKHNPNNINRSEIHAIYNETLNGIDNFTNIKIAVSKPRNLRDILCHTQIPSLQDCNVSDILNKIINNCKTTKPSG
jgi:hypothetical protein